MSYLLLPIIFNTEGDTEFQAFKSENIIYSIQVVVVVYIFFSKEHLKFKNFEDVTIIFVIVLCVKIDVKNL